MKCATITYYTDWMISNDCKSTYVTINVVKVTKMILLLYWYIHMIQKRNTWQNMNWSPHINHDNISYLTQHATHTQTSPPPPLYLAHLIMLNYYRFTYLLSLIIYPFIIKGTQFHSKLGIWDMFSNRLPISKPISNS